MYNFQHDTFDDKIGRIPSNDGGAQTRVGWFSTSQRYAVRDTVYT